MIDSNYNNTEVLADVPEEQASQPIVKVFAARSKVKAKPQRRELVDLPSIIPMNERKWIGIEPGESSLSAHEISKSNQSSSVKSTFLDTENHCKNGYVKLDDDKNLIMTNVDNSDTTYTNKHKNTKYNVRDMYE